MKKLLLIIFVLLPTLAFAELVPAQYKNGKWGYKESGYYSDKFVIKPKFEAAHRFAGDHAFACQKGLWGIIDKDGKFAIKPKYSSASEPYNKTTIIGLNGKFGLAKDITELTAICYDHIKYSTKGNYFFAQSNGKYGLLDGQSGKALCEIKYDDIQKYEHETFLIKSNGKCGLLDKQGKLITAELYDDIQKYEYDTFLIKSNGKYGLLDKQGKLITAELYDDIQKYEHKTLLVKTNGKYGLLDKQGQVVVPAKYDNIVYVQNDTFFLVNGNNRLFVNAKGKEVDIPNNVLLYTTSDDTRIELVEYHRGTCTADWYTTVPTKSNTYYNCFGIMVFDMPLTSITNGAFSRCSSLTSITIPKSVTWIGEDAFDGCENLTGVYISDLSAWCRIYFNSNPLRRAGNLYLNGKLVTELTIPSDITTISSAFCGCTSLTSITIPNSVTEIGAFSGCSSLTSVTIGNGVTEIGDYAFSGCSSLTSVTIPDSVTSIGSCAFEDCSSLTSITIPNSVTSIGDRAFYGCSSLTSITIPNSVTSIGEEAFRYCSRLTSITIPNSVTSFGKFAFDGCENLGVYISDLSAWCKIDFYRCECNPLYYAKKIYLNGVLAAKLVIPSDVTSVGMYTFYGCSSLKSVTIPNSVTEIGDSAFSGCSSLTSVIIGNGVAEIGDRAFYGCASLKSVYFNTTIPPYLGYDVFDYYGGRICCPIYVPSSSLKRYMGVGGNWDSYSQYLRGR